MKEVDNKEITNRIYDTLLKNKLFPQILIKDIEEQFVEASKGEISFEYLGSVVKIKITSNKIEKEKV